MPTLEELLAANAAPDVPAEAPPAQPAPLDQLLALNELPDEAPVAEAAPPAPPAPVRVRAPDGTTGTVAPEDLPAARLEGYTLYTPEMQADEQQQARYGDGAGQAIAAVQGFGRGVSMGATDYLQRIGAGIGGALGAPDVPRAAGPGMDAPLAAEQGPGLYDDASADAFAQDIQGYRDANQGTAIASELTGAIAPAVFSGGAGAAGTVARFTPVGQLASLSTKFAGHLMTGATEAGLGVAGRIAAAALVAGGEAGADSAVRRLTDDLARGDVDPAALGRTVERMTDSAWDAAKWGALLGGGVAGLGEGVGAIAARRAAKASAAADTAPEAAQVAEAVSEKADDMAVQSRPLPDVDADLAAAKARLYEAQSAGGETDELEDAVASLLQEQESALVANNGLTTTAQIDHMLKVEPTPEALGILDRVDHSLNRARNAQELQLQLDDATDMLGREMTDELDAMSKFRVNALDPLTNRSNKPQVVRAAIEADELVWTPDHATRITSLVDRMDNTLKGMSSISEHAIYDKPTLASFKAGREALEKVKKRLSDMTVSGKIFVDGKFAKKIEAAERKLEEAKLAVDYSKTSVPAKKAFERAQAKLDDLLTQAKSEGMRINGRSVRDVEEIFTSLDYFKTFLGRFAAEKGLRPTSMSEATFQKLYMLLRAELQDPAVFGKTLAEMQTVTNAATTRMIQKTGAFDRLLARAGIVEQGGVHNFTPIPEFDPKKMGAFLGDAANPLAYKDARDFITGLTARVEHMETMAKYYGVTGEELAGVAAQRQMLDRFTAKFRAHTELALKARAAKRLASQTSHLQEIIAGVRALPFGGGALATIAGSSVVVAKTLASGVVALAKGGAKQEQEVAKAVKATFKNLGEGAPVAASTTKAAARRALPGVGIASSQLSTITERQVSNAIKDARELQNPDSDKRQNLHSLLRDVSDESPELAAALEAQVLAKADFIAAKAGPESDDSDPFSTAPPLIDPLTARSMARYVDAARSPGKALSRLAHGVGSREDIETLRALYPHLYQDYVDRVVEKLKKTKIPPTMLQRQELYRVTGVPMTREQRPEYMRAIQAMHQANPGTEPPAEGPARKGVATTRKAAPLDTGADQLMARSDAIMTGTDD